MGVGRQRGAVLGALAVALTGVGCVRWGLRYPIADTREEARDEYLGACASCHGAEGHGDGPESAALTGAVPDLTHLAAQHGGAFPRQYVIDIMTGDRPLAAHGAREMPVWRERFGPVSGATAAAALYARRRMELIADHLEGLQR
jgi:mono/diheme cytochrome c family protein